MESWRKVWRDALSPLLSLNALEALKSGLEDDDKSLCQGNTTYPLPGMYSNDWPVEAACAISYCGWKGEDLNTVGEVEEYFARMCFEIDQKLGEPAGCRYFINWYDDTPRKEVFDNLLEEVNLSIMQRLMGEICQVNG